jgi:DNA primase
VADQALFQTLESNPQLHQISLCLDNDEPGLAANKRIAEKLQQAGYSHVSCLLSSSKDWNADLVVERSAPEHTPESCLTPQMT